MKGVTWRRYTYICTLMRFNSIGLEFIYYWERQILQSDVGIFGKLKLVSTKSCIVYAACTRVKPFPAYDRHGQVDEKSV